MRIQSAISPTHPQRRNGGASGTADRNPELISSHSDREPKTLLAAMTGRNRKPPLDISIIAIVTGEAFTPPPHPFSGPDLETPRAFHPDNSLQVDSILSQFFAIRSQLGRLRNVIRYG